MKYSKSLNNHINKLRTAIESKFDVNFIQTYISREGSDGIKVSINISTKKGVLHFSKVGYDYYNTYSEVFKLAQRELRKCKACHRKRISKLFSNIMAEDPLPAA
jgi:ribosome-associated translation inhibitor RaiA